MPEAYVDAKYLQETAELLKHLKRHTYEWMHIRPGHHVVDLGCGPGVDTIPLSKYVGKHGRVIGVDIDADMIRKANEYAQQEGVSEIVTHRVADVASLPFNSEDVDACRAERLFQVLPPSIGFQQVFPEMLRVTKPGGWVVIADTDWATASVDFPDTPLERKLIRFFSEQVRPNGYAGRQFFRCMKQQGLLEVKFQVFPVVQRQFTHSPFDDWLIQEAVSAQVVSHAEADVWRTTLMAREAAGEFYATVNMVVLAGRKP
jgi:ubiquinone/menaquinone biosynthesis C-methylase UbiE